MIGRLSQSVVEHVSLFDTLLSFPSQSPCLGFLIFINPHFLALGKTTVSLEASSKRYFVSCQFLLGDLPLLATNLSSFWHRVAANVVQWMLWNFHHNFSFPLDSNTNSVTPNFSASNLVQTLVFHLLDSRLLYRFQFIPCLQVCCIRCKRFALNVMHCPSNFSRFICFLLSLYSLGS